MVLSEDLGYRMDNPAGLFWQRSVIPLLSRIGTGVRRALARRSSGSSIPRKLSRARRYVMTWAVASAFTEATLLVVSGFALLDSSASAGRNRPS